MRVLFFGDSITQGLWDLEGGGWVQRLRNDYDKQSIKKMPAERQIFYNLGVDANTTADVVKRLSYEVEARRFQDDPFLLVFQVGLNDTTFAGEETMSTPEKYRDELDVLISGARHYSDQILFIGITPIDDKLCHPWIHSSTGKCWENKRILEFEEALRKICIDQKVAHVQLFEKFQAAMGQQQLLADGLHPNDAGHQLIADLVKPKLDSLLG